MTDATMTPSPDSEWREWYRREYGCEPTYGPPFGANPAASLAAWTAAAQLRDELTKLERDVVESAMTAWSCTLSKAIDMQSYGAVGIKLSRACAALRAARQPKPVDHLREAHRALALLGETPLERGGQREIDLWNEVNDHITAEIAARRIVPHPPEPEPTR